MVGPIEICVDGQYESLCDIGWDEVDAQAFCRQQVRFDAGKQLKDLSLSLSLSFLISLKFSLQSLIRQF